MAPKLDQGTKDLIQALLPALQTILQGGISIFNTIREHPATPEAAKAQLDQISTDVTAVAAKVDATARMIAAS